MLFRAVFWIGLVALLMPREPDVGYGRPHAAVSLPTEAASWLDGQMRAHPDLCTDHGSVCNAGADLLTGMHALALRSLGEVKAEIEASQRQRVIRAHAI